MDIITISPSTVPWLACQKKFHTLAVLRQHNAFKEPSPVLRFANILHEAMRRLYEPRSLGLLPHIEQLDTILDAVFLRAPYRCEDDRAYDRKRCRQLIVAYVAMEEECDAILTVAVETGETYSARKNGTILYNMTARIDRIVARSAEVCIGIDYKLSTRLPDPEQILINMLVLRKLMPGFPRYEFHIDSLHEQGFDRTTYHSHQMKGLLPLVTERAEQYLEAKEYAAQPGEQCLFCPLQPDCRPRQTIDIEQDFD